MAAVCKSSCRPCSFQESWWTGLDSISTSSSPAAPSLPPPPYSSCRRSSGWIKWRRRRQSTVSCPLSLSWRDPRPTPLRAAGTAACPRTETETRLLRPTGRSASPASEPDRTAGRREPTLPVRQLLTLRSARTVWPKLVTKMNRCAFQTSGDGPADPLLITVCHTGGTAGSCSSLLRSLQALLFSSSSSFVQTKHFSSRSRIRTRSPFSKVQTPEVELLICKIKCVKWKCAPFVDIFAQTLYPSWILISKITTVYQNRGAHKALGNLFQRESSWHGNWLNFCSF